MQPGMLPEEMQGGKAPLAQMLGLCRKAVLLNPTVGWDVMERAAGSHHCSPLTSWDAGWAAALVNIFRKPQNHGVTQV